MRVAFNARLLAQRTIHGWNRYTLNLLRELGGLGVELLLFTDQPLHPEHLARLPEECSRVRLAPPMRYPLWQHGWTPRQCAVDRVDVFHTPFNYGLPWFSACRRVLTLHDAIQSPQREPFRQRLHGWMARVRAHQVITVSQHARLDLSRRLGIAPERITVTYEAADPRFHQPVSDADRRRVRGRHELGRPYVLYIGSWRERKNLPFLIRGFAAASLPDADLVLAGGQPEQHHALQNLARDCGVAQRLRLIDWVEDAELPALYAEALCFVYSSLNEGFGLQLCEAMSVGCPVLAARASCLPEVLGAGGETFALHEIGELQTLLRRVASEPGYRAELAARARARAADFCWRRTAEQTLAVYRRALQDP